MIKKFDNFLKESIRDKMVGPSGDILFQGLYNDMLTKSFQMGFLDGIKKALELGADFNKLSLSNACSNGYSDIVIFLIENGKDVNKSDGHFTPLGRAIQGGHLDTVKTLIDLGADTNYITTLSNGPIGYSSSNERISMIGLAQHFKKPDIFEYLKSIKLKKDD